MMNDKNHKSIDLPDSTWDVVKKYIEWDKNGTWEDIRRRYRKNLKVWEVITKEE